jgi:hypothetical protein
MKERKLVIEIDDSAIDSVIEKVRLLKDELRSLNLPINISVAVPAALKPEEERNTQDARYSLATLMPKLLRLGHH